jgi:hypothetical protein
MQPSPSGYTALESWTNTATAPNASASFRPSTPIMSTSPETQAYRHDFEAHTKGQLKPGLTCDGHAGTYLPHQVVAAFWTKNNIQEVLYANGVHDADPETIFARYLRVFSILLVASVTVPDSISYITDLISYRNDDTSLPWTNMPHGLQGLDYGRKIFDEFLRLQWKFCPVLLDLQHKMSDTTLDRRAIFPVSHEKTVNSERQAREATVRIMRVHEDAHAHLPDSSKPPTSIALKIFPPNKSKEYRNEKRVLTEFHGRSPNIVQSLGSYTYVTEGRQRTCVLILEHALHGTLADVFSRDRPPYTTERIQAFWNGILETIKGLEVMHERNGLQVYPQAPAPCRRES